MAKVSQSLINTKAIQRSKPVNVQKEIVNIIEVSVLKITKAVFVIQK